MHSVPTPAKMACVFKRWYLECGTTQTNRVFREIVMVLYESVWGLKRRGYLARRQDVQDSTMVIQADGGSWRTTEEKFRWRYHPPKYRPPIYS